jgi:predicted Zn-dependent peptidase
MTELQWVEIDGVKTVWAEAPAPLRAGLYFRTGRVDESLATSGHTHLIEHLAFATLGDTSPIQNGYVAGAETVFYMTGRAGDVASFLGQICRGLSNLPSDRLDAEKRILLAENATRSYNVFENLLTWRYGATGYGLYAMPEYGIPGATIDGLQDYATRRFTKENAVLWLTGPPPADLRLELPHGNKLPLPPLKQVQTTFPSFFVDDGCGGVAVGSTVPRVSAASIFRELALKRLRKRLRTDQAISYAPSIAYWPLGANLAHLAIYADSHGEHREDLAKVFGEAFEELGDFDEFEIAEARDQVLEGWTGTLAPPEADRILGDLQRAAMDWVLEKEYESLETIADGVSAVTRDDLSAYHGELVGTAMFALPSVARLRDSFGERAPISSVPIVNGEIIASADAPIDKTQLVSGPSGVSVLYSNGSDITVRYEYLAAVIDFTDGCVCLIGEDATWLAVEPTLWRGGHRVCRQIRERSPDHLVVEERTRSRDEIPRPNTTGWQRFLARLTLR